MRGKFGQLAWGEDMPLSREEELHLEEYKSLREEITARI
jgi:hypothetical protein